MAPAPVSTVQSALMERTAVLNTFKNKPYVPESALTATFGTPTSFSLYNDDDDDDDDDDDGEGDDYDADLYVLQSSCTYAVEH